MPVYLIEYYSDEKNLETEDYDDLIDELEDYEDCYHVVDNTWLICSDDSADDVHKYLSKYIYEGDCILVTKVDDNYRGSLPESAVDWLKKYVKCGSGGMADALASGASRGDPVEVQVLSAAPSLTSSIGKVSLMSNYEMFKEFLDKNNTRYSEEALKTNERFFRLPQKLKSGGFVDILVVFAEKNIKIRIFGIATIEEEEKKIACYKLFNEMAAQYNFFRMYVHPNGDISLEGDVVLGVVEGEFQPKALMGFVIAAINFLEKSYKNIMKIQWS